MNIASYHPTTAILHIMFISIICIALLFIAYSLCYQLYYTIRLTLNGTYGIQNKLASISKDNWLLGVLKQIDPAYIHLQMNEFTKRHDIGNSKNFTFRIVNQLVLVVADPNDANAILNSRHSGFIKNATYKRMLGLMMPNAMLITEGDHWLRQRKLLNPAFHYQSVRNMHSSIWEECEILFDICEKHANEKTAMNIALQMEGLTLDVLGKTGFAFDFKAQDNPQFRVSNALHNCGHKVTLLYITLNGME
jgi:cytochrome P450